MRKIILIAMLACGLTAPGKAFALPKTNPNNNLVVTQTKFEPPSLTFTSQADCQRAASARTMQVYSADPFINVCSGRLNGSDSISTDEEGDLELPSPFDTQWAWGVEVIEHHACYKSTDKGVVTWKTFMAAKSIKTFDHTLFRKFKGQSLEDCKNILYIAKSSEYIGEVCYPKGNTNSVGIPVRKQLGVTTRPSLIEVKKDGSGLLGTSRLVSVVDYKYTPECVSLRPSGSDIEIRDFTARWLEGLPPTGAFIPCSGSCLALSE